MSPRDEDVRTGTFMKRREFLLTLGASLRVYRSRRVHSSPTG
jgi:hypothetical protein